jgi:hypothetical protein
VKRGKGQGNSIGRKKQGKVPGVIGPARPEQVDLIEVFARMDEIRKRSRKPKHVSVKELIEEGRR